MSVRLTGWDPIVLARMATLELQARELVAGLAHGGHRSVRVNSNIEFADYKPYSPGDPLRDLDWRVVARTDRLVVRRHRAEDELAVTLVVDASADMATGTRGRYGEGKVKGSKWSTATVMAATLAHWLIHRGDPVGLAVLGGESVRWPWLAPAGGLPHLSRILGVLSESRPGGKAEIEQGLAFVGTRVRRRSLVILLSDLMEPPEVWGPALDAFGERRTDVRVLHLHDSGEWDFDFNDIGKFYSLEDGDFVGVDPRDVREQFASVVAEYTAEVRNWLGRNRANHVLMATSDDPGRSLARLVRGL